MALPENIRHYRERAGLSQKELAEKVGVGQQMIAKYEEGSKIPSLFKAVHLARALHTTCEALIKTERE